MEARLDRMSTLCIYPGIAIEDIVHFLLDFFRFSGLADLRGAHVFLLRDAGDVVPGEPNVCVDRG